MPLVTCRELSAARHQNRSPMTGKKLPNTDLLPNISLAKACDEYAKAHSTVVHLDGPRLATLSSRLAQLAHVLPHPQWSVQLCRVSAQHCAADAKSDKSALSSQLSSRAAAAQAAAPAATLPGAAAPRMPPAAPAAAAAGSSGISAADADTEEARVVINSVTSSNAVEFTCSQVGLGPNKRLVWTVHNRHPAGRTVSVTLSWVPVASAPMASDGTLRSTRHNYFMPAAPVTLLVQARETREVYSSKAVKQEKAFASSGREWQFKWAAVRGS